MVFLLFIFNKSFLIYVTIRKGIMIVLLTCVKIKFFKFVSLFFYIFVIYLSVKFFMARHNLYS